MEIGLILIIVIILIGITGIKIIPQSRASVVERLGAYHRTMQTGLHYVIPFFERVASSVSLKEIVKDFAPQPVITKDNVTIKILLHNQLLQKIMLLCKLILLFIFK